MTASSRKRRFRSLWWLPETVMSAPAVVLFVMMYVIPVGLAVYLSMTDWDGFSLHPSFIGGKNYSDLLQGSRTISSAIFTGIIAVVGTVLCNALGLFFAVLISRQSRAHTVVRTLMFYPHVISALIIGFLWTALLAPSGVVNSMLAKLGLGSIPFLSDPTFAAVCIIATIVWAGYGLNLILYIAGLKSVPTDYYEASTLDGASKWQQFTSITFPMIAPVVTVNLVIVLVSLLRTYDLVLALTTGGPAGLTQTVVYQIIFNSFQNNKLGFGSAQGVVLMVVTAVLGVVITLMRRRAENNVTE